MVRELAEVDNVNTMDRQPAATVKIPNFERMVEQKIKEETAKSNIAALHSRKFTSAQEDYMTTDRECLAIVDALKAFGTQLLGIPFTIITDHKAIEHMMYSMPSTASAMKEEKVTAAAACIIGRNPPKHADYRPLCMTNDEWIAV